MGKIKLLCEFILPRFFIRSSLRLRNLSPILHPRYFAVLTQGESFLSSVKFFNSHSWLRNAMHFVLHYIRLAFVLKDKLRLLACSPHDLIISGNPSRLGERRSKSSAYPRIPTNLPSTQQPVFFFLNPILAGRVQFYTHLQIF